MHSEKIKKYLQELGHLKSIHSLLHWDMETMMPSGAISDRAQQLSYVHKKVHQLITSKKYQRLLEEFESQKLNRQEKKLQRELRWDFELLKAQPVKHVEALSQAQTIASHVWAKARQENDWASFCPHLQQLIDLKRRETTFFKVKRPYDALLRMHDKEFDSREINILFADLRKGLIKLKNEVESDGTFTRVKDLKGPFDLAAQARLSSYVTSLFGLPAEHSRLDVSTHPFSINISPLDQRITTRYVPENLDSFSSTMHEVGHALYEFNLPREWAGTPFQEAVSLSVHESQSRFWENVIGRSREFCQFIHPHMKTHFPRSMKGVDEEELYRYFNKSVPGLIRVESSELFYNLHVIIRFEIEEMIFNQGLNAAELPDIWNEKYHSYLGLKPESFTTGVLQDSHWAGGAFGYFHTYTLGNLISGSLQQQMLTALPGLKREVIRGDFSGILNYLKEKIYSRGRSINSRDIVGELQVNDYLKYLSDKFRRK